MLEIQIVGAGPAGTSAAIAALSEGAAVHIVERSREARNKVCGEFIPHEACRVLEALGVWPDFLRLSPARIRRTVLCFGSRTKQWNLREPAFSLSRLELDRLILERAMALGARLSRGESFQAGAGGSESPIILANGRHGKAPRPGRLFGFKAHFDGPADDAVELHFTRFGYAGISAVENNRTNVCGLASEEVLRGHDFEIDELVRTDPVLADRLRPLSRCMPWLTTGPLVFSRVMEHIGAERIYSAGDALGFVDPFTGSGILNALLTGRLAGAAAARQVPSEAYVRQCAGRLNRAYTVSAVFRVLLPTGLSNLALLVPGDWLYRLTRANVQGVG